MQRENISRTFMIITRFCVNWFGLNITQRLNTILETTYNALLRAATTGSRTLYTHSEYKMMNYLHE